jgi:hypothetical protein
MYGKMKLTSNYVVFSVTPTAHNRLPEPMQEEKKAITCVSLRYISIEIKWNH